MTGCGAVRRAAPAAQSIAAGAAVALATAWGAASAQPPRGTAAAEPWLGSVVEDRARDAQLLVRADPSGFLLRSVSTESFDSAQAHGFAVRALLPADDRVGSVA